MQQPAASPNSAQERTRLVDHFKRAYQIIVGLSITLACTKLFPGGFPKFPFDTSFWLFCTFFITIVPIFHGGDRSLDIKYLQARPAGVWGHAAYIWDVYMLLITAILFVKIAQAIPVPGSASGSAILGASAPTSPNYFYRWMATMLFIDAAILIVDGVKSRFLAIDGGAALSSYVKWIVLNALLGVVCMCAAYPPEAIASLSELTIALIVFGLAFLRTVMDYIFGRKFMFP